MSKLKVSFAKLRAGYRLAISGEDTPHLNPLPQGERKQEKGWIPDFSRMTDNLIDPLFQNDNLFASFDNKHVLGL
jgi:hypothetical protein